MMMRRFVSNSDASVVPVILFCITILGCGALYSLFFIEVALPSLGGLIPSSDSKTFVLMVMYAVPLFIFLVGIFALLKSGVKQVGSW